MTDADNGGRRRDPQRLLGLGIGLGLALGAAFGLLIDNLATGVAVGLVIGLGFGASLQKKAEGQLRDRRPEDEPPA
jgi:hypothetical protein